MIRSILFITLIPLEIFAVCAFGGISVFPETNTIENNNYIIIEGYGDRQQLVSKLGKRHPVYLSSEKHQVELVRVTLNRSKRNRTQILFKPSKKLRVGEKYQLKIHELKNSDTTTFKRWNSTTEKSENYTWAVTETKLLATPIFSQKPMVTKRTYVRYGCGPASHVYFNLKLQDTTSNFIIKVELKNNGGLITDKYIITSNTNEVKIGYGMCSGEFDFKPNKKYSIRFKLVSNSTSPDSNWSEWVMFKSPKRKIGP